VPFFFEKESCGMGVRYKTGTVGKKFQSLFRDRDIPCGAMFIIHCCPWRSGVFNPIPESPEGGFDNIIDHAASNMNDTSKEARKTNSHDMFFEKDCIAKLLEMG
jgi:hypothetical protein